MARKQLPDRFGWGAATPAYQIEGAAREDGKGLSIWDVFCQQPGRVLPVGSGEANDRGLDLCDRPTDALLARDIKPCATLYHWDLPQSLQDRGGCDRRDTAEHFTEYAALIPVAAIPSRREAEATARATAAAASAVSDRELLKPHTTRFPPRLSAVTKRTCASSLWAESSASGSSRIAMSSGPAIRLSSSSPWRSRLGSSAKREMAGPSFGFAGGWGARLDDVAE